jgi:hypothetical protein
VWWVDCKPPDFSGGYYQITERGRELLDEEANSHSGAEA